MIKVLIVDDSAFIRNAFSQMLKSDPEIEVVGTARNGDDALDKVRELDPDVVTMDIEMPRRDGLSAVQEIMATMPRPVLMVSTLTTEGADATLKALEYGAADYIPKFEAGRSVINLQHMQEELCERVKAVARSRRWNRQRTMGASARHVPSSSSVPSRPTSSLAATSAPQAARRPASSPVVPVFLPHPGMHPIRDCVVIGVSTGGPPAVQRVLSALPADFPVFILIAQHMPGTFTGPFAERLNGVCKISVKEAEDGEQPKPGHAYIAPGGKHLVLEGRSSMPRLRVTAEPVSALYKPSATVLMESVGRIMGSRALGVMMTGMGSDGCEGAKVLKQRGGCLIAQNEASCVVYGMPKAVVDAGLADEIVSLDALAESIVTALYK